MLRKLSDGFAWGAGLALGILIIWSLWFHFILPRQLEGTWSISAPTEVATLPAPDEADSRFYGPFGSVDGNFRGHGTVLASGDGRILGRITADDEGVDGVRIRLALNGTAYSQWAETETGGVYAVPVPYGEYRIDGYELDRHSANRMLAGFIGAPTLRHSSTKFTVSADRPGEGLNLAFGRPVLKIGPSGAVRLDEEIVLRWHPHPRADHYQVRISESETFDDPTARGIFGWSEEPRTKETHLNLAPYKDLLKVGHYYSFEVFAIDERGRAVSSSPSEWRERDFHIVE